MALVILTSCLFNSQMFEVFHCLVDSSRYPEMPKFWGWLSSSTYVGTTTVDQVVYDVWGTNVSPLSQ